jgi:hypothetical protein
MEIDLPPKDWKSDRVKPREPFWGPGVWNGLAYLLGMVLMSWVMYLLRS